MADSPTLDHDTRIAVVITFHCDDRHFPEALASVRAQTRIPDQIVVVDDASPAGRSVTLGNLAADVLVIRLATNVGVGPARQIGTESTDAHLVAYLDADDWWEPGYLAAMVTALARYPAAPAAYASIVKRYPDGRQATFVDKPAMLDVREAIVRSHLLVSGFVVRRQALDLIGGWRRERGLVEDWDLYLRLLDSCGPVPLMAEPLVNYRVGDASRMNSRSWQMIRKWRRTLVIDREVVEKHYGQGSARRRLAQAYEDRRDRAGGWRGRCYGAAARLLGPPLRESSPQ